MTGTSAVILCPGCRCSFTPPPGADVPCHCSHCGSTVIGRCCDLAWIGGGAMGDVYRGRQLDMGNRVVAVKVPKADLRHAVQRFEREIVASARLKHDNIVCAYDRGEQLGRPFLVMEFVDGRLLRDVVDSEHPLSPRRVGRIVQGVARGLAHAQQQQIINRDLKPDNIILDRANGETAKILDYGLALIVEIDGAGLDVTRSGALLGTPIYMAPEQALEPHAVTMAADVYSLGCTAFYCLTRRAPFTAATAEELRRCHAEHPRPSLRTLRPDVAAEFDQLVARMMSVVPEQRPLPSEIVATLEWLLPQLADVSPKAAAPVSDRIDITCPECGEPYHFSAEALGKRFQCRNKLCRHRFEIAPAKRVGRVTMAESFVSQEPVPTHDVPEAIVPEAIVAEAIVAEAIVAEAIVAEAIVAEAIVAEAIVAEAFVAEAVVAEAVVAEAVVAEAVVAEATVAEGTDATDEMPAPPFVPEMVQALPVDHESARWQEQTPDDSVPTLQAVAIVEETPPVIGGTPAPPAAPADSAMNETVSFVPAHAVGIPLPGSPGESAEFEPPPVLGAAKLPLEQPLHDTDRGMPPIWHATAAEGATADAPTQAETAAASVAPPRRRVTTSRLIEVIVGCLVVSLGSYVGWLKWNDSANAPEKRWKEIQDEIYGKKKWGLAAKSFQDYKEKFPESPHAADVDFFTKICTANEGIWSTTGDLVKGLAAMQTIFKEFRDSPAYANYQFDLYKALRELVKRLTDRGQKAKRTADIDRARQAHELLLTVTVSLNQPEIATDAAELGQQIDQAEKQIQVAVARKNAEKFLTDAADPAHAFGPQQLDATYHQFDELLAQYPDLKQDKALAKLRQAAVGAEAQRVRYIARVVDGGESPPEEQLSVSGGPQTLVVAWGNAAEGASREPAPSDRRSPKQVAALANGVLYVFDRDGHLYWTRRLGIDSDRLPHPVAATASSPDGLIVASSEDGALLSLEAATGEILWRAPMSGRGTAPLTIISTLGDATHPPKRRGLLPTSGGTIQVFELVLGKRMGVYQVGQPMNVGGTFDPMTGLVFFPAESQRVFAIDPAKIDVPSDDAVAACRSVLFTGHASGSLRSEPFVVDRYFVQVEASELEEMRLKAFEIVNDGFSNPRAAPLKELSLPGWSWFSPATEPDRAAIVTDRGVLGLFGFNLDNPQEEAIYPIVVDKSHSPSTQLSSGAGGRAAAIHVEENLVWVLVDGKLQKLAIDLLNQKLRRLWKDELAPAVGTPVHEPQSTGWHDSLVFYLTTMSSDGRQYFASAVAGESGHILWRRQLGLSPLTDPLLIGNDALVIDRSGRVLRLQPTTGEYRGRPYQHIEPDGSSNAGLSESVGDIIVLSQGERPTHLLAKLAGGTHLAIRSLAEDGWNYIKLPEPLHGRPCIVGETLVVPCADGLIHRRPADGSAAKAVNDDPFQWARTSGPREPQLITLGENAVLLVDGARRVQRLEFRTVDTLGKWNPVGDAFTLSDDLVATPVVYENLLLLVERSGLVHALDVQNPGTAVRHWRLDGTASGMVALRAGRLLVALARKRVASIDLSKDVEPADVWYADFAGRLCGAPVKVGDDVWITDDSRQISCLRLNDGKRSWFRELPLQTGPAAAAVPFGKTDMLVPLRDGTLILLPVPTPGQEIAEVGT